jgi:predicted nuclease with TOPRIM domain
MEEEEKEMEAAKEDAQKKLKQAVAENAPIAESQRTQPPDANELQEKFDALVEENGKLKAD